MEEALKTLRDGGVILYPTDTVWGLGCDATNADAVARVFEIKRRSQAKAMIVLVESADDIARYVSSVPDVVWELLDAAKGSSPLTLILQGGVGVANNLLPAEKTIAIRVVEHKFCNDLLHKFRRPLVSTSANISGEPTPMTFEQISEEVISAVDYVVPIEYQGSPTGKSSSIISVGEHGQIAIIRS